MQAVTRNEDMMSRYHNAALTVGNFRRARAHLVGSMPAADLGGVSDRELTELQAALYGLASQVELALGERGQDAQMDTASGGLGGEGVGT